MSDTPFRLERDSMGELRVPADALWGAQTQRAVENFPISGSTMPDAFIRAMALIKWAAARANRDLGLLDARRAVAIRDATAAIAGGEHANQFPVDVFQTGSGTSSNMNCNEVVARLATAAAGIEVHPNDHVNMSQSSNDVVPTAIHVAASLQLEAELLPAWRHLHKTLDDRATEFDAVVKTGRTHLMDAVPLRLGQELGGWAAQVKSAIARVEDVRPRLHRLAQGGTAVGTGINADRRFAGCFASELAQRTGLPFLPAGNFFESISCQDTAVELSGQLRVMAVVLMKISNDLRWMNSGPLAGLAEIALPALQPGSSIMPGKVNPVIPEAVAMAAAQVIGNDCAVTLAGQSGNFQLNVMLPVIASNLLQSIRLMASCGRVLADKAIAGFTVNPDRLADALARNPILVTALNSIIGYEQGAAIAKQAYAERRPILDVALETTGLSEQELRRYLDPERLTRGGLES